MRLGIKPVYELFKTQLWRSTLYAPFPCILSRRGFIGMREVKRVHVQT
jgi:hypothetical protein